MRPLTAIKFGCKQALAFGFSCTTPSPGTAFYYTITCCLWKKLVKALLVCHYHGESNSRTAAVFVLADCIFLIRIHFGHLFSAIQAVCHYHGESNSRTAAVFVLADCIFLIRIHFGHLFSAIQALWYRALHFPHCNFLRAKKVSLV